MSIQQTIFNTARGDGMPVPLANFIVMQAGHETGGFDSNVMQSCNNLFGYKWVGQSTAAGSCTVSPESDYYAKYNSLVSSVHELTLWIRRRQKDGIFPQDLNTITTPAQYAQLLKKGGFYGDSVDTYTNGLLHFPSNFTGSVAFLPLIAATAAFWLITRKKRK